MTSRIVKVRPPAESAANSDSHVITSQRKRPEARYWLQVDRQTKSSHATSQAAEEAGALIKKSASDRPGLGVRPYRMRQQNHRGGRERSESPARNARNELSEQGDHSVA